MGLGAVLLGLAMGLDKALGPRPSVDDVRREFCERLDALEEETDWLRDLQTDGPDKGWSPCDLKFRQHRLRAGDRLKELQEVTRHPEFPKMVKAQRGLPRCTAGRDSRYHFNNAQYYMRDYDELFRDFDCPMVWTEDQG